MPLTNLDQPLFDGAGAVKRDLVDYLDAVHHLLIGELRDRPLSVIRVLRGQAPFMQKNVPKYTPEWVPTVAVWAEASKREVSYALCNDRRTLLWFANQRAVEYHPTLALAGHMDHPTYLILDLDPPDERAFGAAVRAALLVREALAGRPGRRGQDQRGQGRARVRAGGRAGDQRGGGRGHPGDRRPRRTAGPGAGHHGVHQGRPRGQGVPRLDQGRRGDRGGRLQPADPAGRAGVVPGALDELESVAPADFTLHTAPPLLAGSAPWAGQMPAPQPLSADLIEEGRAIPIARVQAMHEGKRRARARRKEGGE